jgi:hypothetical protein
MYLQLHDDWTTDNFPGFTTDKFAMVGKKPMPLKKVYALSGTCAVNLPSDLLKTTGQGWVDALKDVQKQYKAIAEGKKDTPEEQVTKSKFNQPSSKSMANAGSAITIATKWIAVGTAVYAALTSIAYAIINNKSIGWYNDNKFDVQNLCAMNAQQVANELNNIDLTYADLVTRRSQMSYFDIQRVPVTIEIAALSQYRLVYQKQLDALTGKKADLGKIATIVGLIAAARGLF